MSDRWESAFVAVGAIVGEPLEHHVAALGNDREAHCADLLQALRSSSRDTRARALARVVSEIAVAIESLRFA